MWFAMRRACRLRGAAGGSGLRMTRDCDQWVWGGVAHSVSGDMGRCSKGSLCCMSCNNTEEEAASLKKVTVVNMAQSICILVHLSTMFDHQILCTVFICAAVCVTPPCISQ